MKTVAAIAIGIAAMLVTAFALGQAAQPGGVAAAPPVVVKTFPEAGKTDVPATVKEVRVMFSKPMTDKSWSWSTDTRFGEALPGTAAPHYLDNGRTCVMPVKLEPGRSYAVWLNSENFQNFKDAQGRPAVPYLLVFQTK